ncbi:hypothetical protein GLI01_20710 [Gluconacetobacter liquefaciens]|uniref:Phenylpyruvate tautomerase PptA (4-oxalocrotonate tautomerase family) n=1 Tax=Gluconacetobacter liquefaciens TaxID=89584 RepID=A0A370G9W5_GLULI|nr:tautomerase family protein [Gluconacetobacter liquefaciens]MBB2185461.1 hypothetical protein [Gluconacetobacter liquefaciens]RDI39264.1 phenylpyruvate tautomerase PptA (4-oxalocrotonate tautomerase family) [Gluconacetobacter liquefaciens]GBR02583.1 4-oxalocrotonate tautomerase [Gluconacetobacter liquefaciens NRIC 0522]GEB38036.1 hypothetical protein GLI01_20710 [Gluconacetobacter liquefaciens]
MPTYVCSFPAASLSDDQQKRIAEAISLRHHEATGAPTFFVQVVIDQNPTKKRFIGGQPKDTHAWIRADIRSGRAPEIRQRLMLNILADVAEISGIDAQNIWIYLNNIEATDMVEFGHVLPNPGDEDVWLQHLPIELKVYLKKLIGESKSFEL